MTGSARPLRHRFHGTPARRQRLVELVTELASAGQRLRNQPRRRDRGQPPSLRERRDAQRRRLLQTLIDPLPRSLRRHHSSQLFWQRLRWLGVGVLLAVLLQRLAG
ncbi:MAG: hypothetical protein ERJ67_08900 [Aphanocapsa feldmannii 277cV]|uniref:Uncharacterized protein n=2 Tax=Aphanocapsa feldmannii TaxID=192050 RepID=A0A524RL95_9CHRO|nr:MAG: hypothetical protein ERJ69_07715 [Aphanocapsa feldmannii 288cV]TGG90840.1 MAG: hypothetical protein ERJ67_08900 [Aphanocapsa feldmannii 277cV]TGH22665.1 MAG: hypothetical protein ERJ68_04530 [Aphanocapsa feldmannii 277cI]